MRQQRFLLKKTHSIYLCYILFPIVCCANVGEIYRPGLTLYEKGRYLSAAVQWSKLSKQILAESETPDNLKQAALALVLASIAYETAEDAQAYYSWSDAIRYYLQASTQWLKERTLLKKKIDELTALLTSGNPDTTQALTGESIILLELDNLTSLSNYQGPHPGLMARDKKPQKGKPITVTRDYLARPLAIVDEQTNVIPGQSKYAAVETSDSEDGNNSPFSRGVAAQETTGSGEQIAEIGSVDNTPAANNTRVLPDADIPEPGIPLVDSFEPLSVFPLDDDIESEFADIDEPSVDEDEQNSAPEQPSGSRFPPPFVEVNEQSEEPEVVPLLSGGAPSIQAFTDFSETDLLIAKTAWRYFLTNYQQNTGLFNAARNYPYVTVWGLGSSVAALVCVEQLGMLDTRRFNKYMRLLLNTLSQLPLYNDELPNREYNTQTGKMVDVKNRITLRGSGWSAVDIGRLLIWLKIVASWYPELEEQVNSVIQEWNFERLRYQQQMNGTYFNGRKEEYYQEGRLGYEQYAAMGYYLWKMELANALDFAETEKVEILGVEIQYDTRQYAYLTSEAFMLARMELGDFNHDYTSLLESLYKVQKLRWENSAILTALSEESLDRKPWFIYNTVYFNGTHWNSVSPSGDSLPELRSLSTKAAIAWQAIYPDDYTDQLKQSVEKTMSPQFGYYAGRYENGDINRSLNINTNAIILEAMLYIKRSGDAFLSSENFSLLQTVQTESVGIRRR